MLQDRRDLESNIQKVLNQIKHDRNIVNEIKDRMYQSFGVLHGQTQKIIIGETPIEELDLRLLCLFTLALYDTTNELIINPYQFFTEKEIKIAKRADFKPEENEIKLPLVIENVLQVGPEDYITVMPISFLVKLYNSNLLEYNFETQRNAKVVRKKDRIVQEPNINKKSVKEIANLVKNNAYLPDTITLNVLAGSSDEDEELVYDPAQRKLVIKSGEIDILDGFHRLNGFVNAMAEGCPEMNIQVAIKNYSTRKAQKYVGQINTINKMDVSHLKALKAERYSDFVVKELMSESDLRGKVSQTSRPSRLQGHIVSYAVLADTIDEEFKLESKKDAMDLSGYLIKFFDYLIGSFPDAFLNNIEQVREHSLINNNVTFAGYIVLARRMKEKKIPISDLPSILEKIDFSKSNPMWEEVGVLENGRISRKARQNMKKFFEKLEIGEDN